MSSVDPHAQMLDPHAQPGVIAELEAYDRPRVEIQPASAGDYEEHVTVNSGILLDGSGNNVGVSVYDVRPGYVFTPTRLVITDATGAFTPAAPYTNAGAWIGLFEDNANMGSLIDFAPTTSGGQLLPAVFKQSKDDGAQCRVALIVRVVAPTQAGITLAVNGVGILREA